MTDGALIDETEAANPEGLSLRHDMACVILRYTRDRPDGGLIGRRLAEKEVMALAADLARELAPMIGGRYVPKSGNKAQRDAEVWADFNGKNHQDVIRKHKISRRLLYSILARIRRSKARG